MSTVCTSCFENSLDPDQLVTKKPAYPDVLCFPCAYQYILITLFVCFVALRPKSTAMVTAGQSVNLTTLFPGQAWTSS